MQISQKNERCLAGHVTEAEIFSMQKIVFKTFYHSCKVVEKNEQFLTRNFTFGFDRHVR